jgi:hypothetical protein
MKPALIVFVLLWIAPPASIAQTGAIGIFADPNGASCNILDDGTAGGMKLVHVYIIHAATPGATSSRFRVAWQPCMSLILLDEEVNPSYTYTGTTTSGIQIDYGGCIPSPNVLIMFSFWAQGFTPSCCWNFISADLTASPIGIYATECSDPYTQLPATGWEAVINANQGCLCNWTPAELSTWGQVKALYR